MTRRLATLMALAVFAAAAQGQDTYEIKVYPCPRFAAAPKIDGDLSDACWKAAPLVSGFTFYNKPERAPVQTSFRVGWDDRCLYFAVRCDEPNAGRLTPEHAGRDSHGCFRGETIEIFLDPNHDHAGYYQFAANLAGSFYDARGHDPTWNSKSRLRTKVAADGWTLEMAVPWADLGVAAPRAGKVVGFNVCRDRYVGGRQWSNWSQTMANFHDPVRFAHLVLSPTEKMLGGLRAEFRKGDRRGPIAIFGREGAARKAYLAMAREALTRLDAVLGTLEKEGRAEPLQETRKEMALRLETARHLVEPFRKRIGSGKPLDAAEWARLSVRMASLERQLGELLWEARLAALLKSI